MADFEDKARCYKVGVQLGDTVEDLGQLLEDLVENPLLTFSDFSEFPADSVSRSGASHPLPDLISDKVTEIDQYLSRSVKCGVPLEQTKTSWIGLKEALHDHKVKDAADIFTEFNQHLSRME